jgi:hypothetical protein
VCFFFAEDVQVFVIFQLFICLVHFLTIFLNSKFRCTKALALLAQELELEDLAELANDPEEGLEALVDTELDADTELEVNNNDNDGLGDECDGMSEQDEAELEESL